MTKETRTRTPLRPCLICRDISRGRLCWDCQEAWESSPEQSRANMTYSQAAGRTAMFDFVYRSILERQNGAKS